MSENLLLKLHSTASRIHNLHLSFHSVISKVCSWEWVVYNPEKNRSINQLFIANRNLGKWFEDPETILSSLCRSGTTWSFIFRQILKNRICQRWVVIFTFQPFSLRWLRQRLLWAWVFQGPAWISGVEKYLYPWRELNSGHPVHFLTDIFQLVKIFLIFALKFGVLKIVLRAYNYWEAWSCLFGRSDLCASEFPIRFSAVLDSNRLCIYEYKYIYIFFDSRNFLRSSCLKGR